MVKWFVRWWLVSDKGNYENVTYTLIINTTLQCLNKLLLLHVLKYWYWRMISKLIFFLLWVGVFASKKVGMQGLEIQILIGSMWNPELAVMGIKSKISEFTWEKIILSTERWAAIFVCISAWPMHTLTRRRRGRQSKSKDSSFTLFLICFID